MLACTWLAGAGADASPPWLAWVSDATYAIFLYHLFFVLPLAQALPLPPREVALVPLLAPWVAGCAAPMLLVLAARALLGDRSRLVLGA